MNYRKITSLMQTHVDVSIVSFRKAVSSTFKLKGNNVQSFSEKSLTAM